MTERIKAKRMQSGDTIGIVAPASWPSPVKAKKAATFFEQWGLKVHFGHSLTRQHGYLAGTDEERAAEIHDMFRDDQIKGIFCVCGGYGTPRIGDLLDYDLIRSNPKIFWGYSDITFLHVSILQRSGLVTFHGPMLSSDLGQEDVHPLTIQTFEQLLNPSVFTYSEELSPLTTLVEGKATGTLVGGNISLIVSTLGTPYEIDTKGKLLFIEEVDEEPYRVDRMLNQLRMAGKFADAAGILLCDFRNCVPKKRTLSLSIDEVIKDHILTAGKPTLSGFKVGHCSPNHALPIGVEATLDTTNKTLSIQELPLT